MKSPLWHIPHLTPVASFTEAWIEIEAATLDGETLGSPPSRRRGLNLRRYRSCIRLGLVASFTEAWIEIVIERLSSHAHFSSPPSRRRGLKLTGLWH